MKIHEKIMLDRMGLTEHGPINIVIFGDSISHGAFNGYFDFESVYWNRLRKKLNEYRCYIPVNMICAAIGGTTAKKSLPRLQKQVLIHAPDLVIVCFGLNDVNGPLEEYLASLREIFTRCAACGADVIFMTPNMFNTYVAPDTPEQFLEYAAKTAQMQNDGRLDDYMESAVALARSLGVTVCDCYAKWKKLHQDGTDITALLENRINHPTPQMHELFAEALFDVIIREQASGNESDDAMYRA